MRPFSLVVGVLCIVVPLVLGVWWVAVPGLIFGLWVVLVSLGPRSMWSPAPGRRIMQTCASATSSMLSLYMAAVSDLAEQARKGR